MWGKEERTASEPDPYRLPLLRVEVIAAVAPLTSNPSTDFPWVPHTPPRPPRKGKEREARAGARGTTLQETGEGGLPPYALTFGMEFVRIPLNPVKEGRRAGALLVNLQSIALLHCQGARPGATPGQFFPQVSQRYCPRPAGRGRSAERGRGGGYGEGSASSAACGVGASPLPGPHPPRRCPPRSTARGEPGDTPRSPSTLRWVGTSTRTGIGGFKRACTSPIANPERIAPMWGKSAPRGRGSPPPRTGPYPAPGRRSITG